MVTKPGQAAGGKWMISVTRHPSLFLGLVIALLLALGTGCRLVNTAVRVPGKAVNAVTPGSSEKQPERRPGGGAANADAILG